MITLTYEQAVADLRAIAAKEPDRLGTSDDGLGCCYFEDDKPSCIVGAVLARHGLTRSDLDSASSGRDLNHLPVGSLTMYGVIYCDDRARYLLSSVQSVQDQGFPWGEAVAYAIDRAETTGVPEWYSN